MYRMVNRRSKRMRRLLLTAFSSVFAFLVIAGTSGCSREEPFQPNAASPGTPEGASGSTSQPVLPFHSEPEVKEDGVPGIRSAANAALKPFGSRASARDILPAGTLITVALRGSLSAANVRAGDSFSATLTHPVTIRGKVFADAGALASGVVQSTKTKETEQSNQLGYFELKLVSFEIEGRKIPLQTSSLFARATTLPDSSTANVRLRKGHRLTFRLIAPLSIDDSPAPAVAAISPAPAG